MTPLQQPPKKGRLVKTIYAVIGFTLVLLGLLLFADGFGSLEPAPERAPTSSASPMASGEPLQPLPPTPELAQEKLLLGEKLFSEPRLSATNTVACISCHNLARGGADTRRYSNGVNNTPGIINTPSVFNASLNFVQFWDGRAPTLEAQAAEPLLNPAEMASNWVDLLRKLKADPQYTRDFAALYEDGITQTNVINALVTFERSLVTQNAPFDRYLKGDRSALTAFEIEGYRRFKDYGCASCHQGNNVGGNMFQRFGVMADYFATRPVTRADLGRFNVTGKEEDRYVFKVPSLRNVAVTAPYFHDGSAATLEQAISVMGRYQLGRELTPEDIRALAAFLRTLTGEWRGRALQ
jgi:cytochrome c peroxidase